MYIEGGRGLFPSILYRVDRKKKESEARESLSSWLGL